MLYIWVRATASWDDEQAFRAQLDPAFAVKVEVWNATFAMPYRSFRHEIRRIARLNLSRVLDAAVAPWDEIPDGALVAPVDDDDWFAPDLARVLAVQEPATTGYFWTSTFLEVPIDLGHRLGLLRRRIFPATPPRWLCTTNNYALVKHPDSKPLLAKHTLASAHFARAGGAVRQVARRLSVMNRTLASQTSLGFLRTTISPAALRRKYRRYRALYATPLPPDLAWCEPYRAMMAGLMRELRLR
jgi:hypothetical protein